MRSASSFTGASFDCECGRHHSVDIQRIEVGPHALSKLPECIPAGVSRVLLVADVNTFAACGKNVADILSAHVVVDSFVFPDSELLPDERAVGSILVHLQPDAGLVVAVGSGAINDLCRFISFMTGRPYIVCATAPSMDGYASSHSPLLVNGMKTTHPAHYPLAILADTAVLASAPTRLYAAGVGDILGKYTALADWVLAHEVTGEYYCPFCVGLMREVLDSVVGNVRSGNTGPEAAATLFDALLLAGLSMGMSGCSRPASGAEHHLAHYWESDMLKNGLGHISHGAAVGVATPIVLRLYECMAPYLPKGIDLPSAEEVESLLRMAGGKVTPAMLGVGGALLHDSLLHAMEVRPRYTIFRYAKEKGLLEAFAKAYE